MRADFENLQGFVSCHIVQMNIVVSTKTVNIPKIYNEEDCVQHCMSICRLKMERYIFKSELQEQEILVCCRSFSVEFSLKFM